MMRLPARLAAKLARIRIAQIFNSAPLPSLVHCVDPAEVLHPGSEEPVSHKKMGELLKCTAPVIWISGGEPLRHAGIGHFVRAITQSGHFVFLETDGGFLRRRIHEFQPLPQLFLTVRFDSLQAPSSNLAVEGLRAAWLSGFFTVIHSHVHEGSDVGELSRIRSFLMGKHLDGWLITAESTSEAVARKAAQARRMIPISFWRQFSKHVEDALRSQTQGRESRDARASVPIAESDHAEAHEEGVGIT